LPNKYDQDYCVIASFVVVPPTEKEIKQWSEKGEICKALGHKWIPGVNLSLVYYPEGYPEVRECSVCKKTMKREWGEWK